MEKFLVVIKVSFAEANPVRKTRGFYRKCVLNISERERLISSRKEAEGELGEKRGEGGGGATWKKNEWLKVVRSSNLLF